MKCNFTSMTLKELAALYNVKLCTFKKWLSPHKSKIGKKIGWYYTPAQVRKIMDLIGEP